MLDLDARGPRLKTQQRQYIPRLHILWLIRDLSTVPDWPSDVGWLSDYKNQSHLPSLTQTSNITQQRSLKQWKLPLYRCTSCAVKKIPSVSPPPPLNKKYLTFIFLCCFIFLTLLWLTFCSIYSIHNFYPEVTGWIKILSFLYKSKTFHNFTFPSAFVETFFQFFLLMHLWSSYLNYQVSIYLYVIICLYVYVIFIKYWFHILWN